MEYYHNLRIISILSGLFPYSQDYYHNLIWKGSIYAYTINIIISLWDKENKILPLRAIGAPISTVLRAWMGQPRDQMQGIKMGLK